MVEALILVVFPFCMVYAVISDTVSMTIANRVPLILLAAFLVAAPLTGLSWEAIGLHLAVGAGVLCVTFLLFAAGGMGGGDAKLIPATALWLGLTLPLAHYLVWSALIGGALTLLLLKFRSSPLADATGHLTLLRNFADRKAGIPYGVALGTAGLLVFPASPLGAWAIASLAAH